MTSPHFHLTLEAFAVSRRFRMLSLALLLGAALSLPNAAAASRVVGYYPAWGIYARAFEIADLPAAKLTHVNYAFANVVNGQCAIGDPWAEVERRLPGDPWSGPGSDAPYFGNFRQLDLLQEQHPHLKTLISIGGWTWSGNFSDAALTPESRATFVSSCVDFMETYGFDGIDIDWEYPGGGGLASNTSRPEDPVNFTLLLEAFRSELDTRGAQNGHAYLLTIAAPAGSDKIAKIEVEKIHGVLDFINVMTYDLNGEWSPISNFNAPLYASPGDPSGADDLNADVALQKYLERGVPADKLVMGIPFYGRAVKGVSSANGGLFQAHGGAPMGTWDDATTGATGMFDYSDIATNYLTKAGVEQYWSADAKVPWLYDPSMSVFLSYDDPTSLGIKAGYVVERGLGGVMIWEMSSDKDDELLDSLVAQLGTTPPPVPEPPPNPDRDPDPGTPPAPGGDLEVTLSVESTWSGGFSGAFVLTNNGSVVLDPWIFCFDTGPAISGTWNGVFDGTSCVSAPSWATSLATGTSTQFGFTAVGEIPSALTGATLNGSPVTVITPAMSEGGPAPVPMLGWPGLSLLFFALALSGTCLAAARQRGPRVGAGLPSPRRL